MLLYNTLTRAKENFTPLQPGRVKMYVCGITAYDLCHIGHARSAVVFDVLARYLRYLGYEVTFARNFTDIDDKIINRAAKEGISSQEVAEKYIQAFYEDMDALGIERADIEPRATEFISEMIALAERLIAKGHAYATPGGDVYFKVRSYAPYGKLSGRDIEDLQAGARVAPGEEKLDPLDFALWKAAKPGEPTWDSPWGPGRPGWHLECSAMSQKLLELPLDIHGGGQDLIFPHHENEVAQSEADCGKDLAKFWLHNGFVRIDSEKMSKSLGNFITIRDIFKHFLPEVLRFFLLGSHYRSPLDYSAEALEEAEKGLRRIYACLAQADGLLAAEGKLSKAALPQELLEEFKTLRDDWRKAMDDDLNSAAALGHSFGLVRLANRLAEDKTLRKSQAGRELLAEIVACLREQGRVYGLFAQSGADFVAALREKKVARKGLDAARIESLVLSRSEARKAKDFARSDELRDELAAMGVEVSDTPSGAVWDVL